MTDASNASPLGIYVHFPWCLTKCPYCDFLSISVDSPAPGRAATASEARASLPHRTYADAVLHELRQRVPRLAPGARPRSIFFGGGTPSLWDPRELGRVVRGVHAAFGVPDSERSSIEVTVECNPTSLDERHLEGLLEAGVNRVSIGVQALDEERLRFLGRLHDESGAIVAVRAALASGMPRVSADLIYGVHRQGPELAVRDVERVAELGVSHLSAYLLTIEPNTRFGALNRTGHLPLLDDDLVARSFELVSEALERKGLAHYEISNFARPGAESVHNRGYWLGDDYLGLGTGAYGTVQLDGHVERVRYKNHLSAERYLRAFDPGREPFDPFVDELAERETIDSRTSQKEVFLLGLRLAEGIDLTRLERRFGLAPWTKERRRAADRLIARGRLEESGGRLRIPKRHWLFADGIIRDLL